MGKLILSDSEERSLRSVLVTDDAAQVAIKKALHQCKIRPPLFGDLDGKSVTTLTAIELLIVSGYSTLANFTAKKSPQLEFIGLTKITSRKSLEQLYQHLELKTFRDGRPISPTWFIWGISPRIALCYLIYSQGRVGAELRRNLGFPPRRVRIKNGTMDAYIDLALTLEFERRRQQEQQTFVQPVEVEPTMLAISPLPPVLERPSDPNHPSIEDHDMEGVYVDASIRDGYTTIAAWRPASRKAAIRSFQMVLPIAAAESAAIEFGARTFNATRIYTDHQDAIPSWKSQDCTHPDSPYYSLSQLPPKTDIRWIKRGKNWIADAIAYQGFKCYAGECNVVIQDDQVILDALTRDDTQKLNTAIVAIKSSAIARSKPSTPSSEQLEKVMFSKIEAIQVHKQRIEELRQQIAEEEHQVRSLEGEFDILNQALTMIGQYESNS